MTDGTAEATNGMIGEVPAATVSDHPTTSWVATAIIAAASHVHDRRYHSDDARCGPGRNRLTPTFRVATAIVAGSATPSERFC